MTAMEFIKHMDKINGSPAWTEDETSLAIALDEYASHVHMKPCLECFHSIGGKPVFSTYVCGACKHCPDAINNFKPKKEG